MKNIYCEKVSSFYTNIYDRQSKSNASCSWIIKALWKIGDEVKEQIFPTFMDKHTIKFMLEVKITFLILSHLQSIQKIKQI